MVGIGTNVDAYSDKDETLTFWINNWDNPNNQNKDARLIKDLRRTLAQSKWIICLNIRNEKASKQRKIKN